MHMVADLSVTLERLLENPGQPDQETLTEFETGVRSTKSIPEDPTFKEMRQFVSELCLFLDGQYRCKKARLEPFQKQVVLHSFYFLVSIKSVELADTMFNLFQDLFGLGGMSLANLKTFKQKASVFLIPRRHGKTWIIVAIISLILASMSNVQIGYVAHQKHVAMAVFAEIIETLNRGFDTRCVEINKETSTITFHHPGKQSSSVMCATCFNKNVSIKASIHACHKAINKPGLT
ncbi:ORF24 [callitrichine gammaherpesvirus 3]|uniref:ORF24 n=1 Tax=callitrichine gammaherpesvirus 3 TaxID=106331 RepID=Q993I6_9GAMA|nr:ORF24 [callitrichine gammaherpesvirus 3]AAK38232.1 ORF24 [callitrichine gammaherpesvirus 3]